MIIQNWWNDGEMGKPKYPGKKNSPIGTLSPEAASGLAWDRPESLQSEAGAVAQLVEALRYKPKGRGFYSRWCQWNFSLT